MKTLWYAKKHIGYGNIKHYIGTPGVCFYE